MTDRANHKTSNRTAIIFVVLTAAFWAWFGPEAWDWIVRFGSQYRPPMPSN